MVLALEPAVPNNTKTDLASMMDMVAEKQTHPPLGHLETIGHQSQHSFCGMLLIGQDQEQAG